MSSKEFTPGHGEGVYDNLKADQPKDHFTIGIQDDVSHTSSPYDAAFSTEPDNVVRAMFYGLGADGTVGANKNSIKIIGENTRQLRAGILRLRFEKIRRDDRFAPALRAAAHPLQLFDFEAPTSSPAISGSSLNAMTCSVHWSGRDVPAQQSVRS